MSRPAVISSAHLVRYSWARWIGLRVWNAATVFQPFAANASRVFAGGRRCSANSGSALGVIAFHRVNETVFRKTVLVLLLISGISLI